MISRPFTFAVYDNASLFPSGLPPSSSSNTVIGATYFGLTSALLGPLPEPVTVSIRAKRRLGPDEDVSAFYYNEDPKNKGWMRGQCEVETVYDRTVVTFSCKALGFYTFFDPTAGDSSSSQPSTDFKPHHWLVYAGAGLAILLLGGI